MKKSKTILAVIALMAILGGLFAFKVRQTDLIYIPTTTALTTLCTVPLAGFTLTDFGGRLTLATTNPNLPCVLTRITFGQ